MKEVLDMLYDRTSIGYMATVDNGVPRVRPWGFMFEENGRLYFCTANNKDVFKQMQANPNVEFSLTNKDMAWLRISGQVVFDSSLEKKEKMFETFPMLKQMYQSPDNPLLEAFYIEHGRAVIDDYSPSPPKVFNF